MGKSSAASKAHKAVNIVHTPQVVSMAEANSQRILKLLNLMDHQIVQLASKVTDQEEASSKELQILTRLVLSLHKDLDKYNQIVYPPAIQEIPSSLPLSIDEDRMIAAKTKHAAAKAGLPKTITRTSPISAGLTHVAQGSDEMPSHSDLVGKRPSGPEQQKGGAIVNFGWEMDPALSSEEWAKLKSQEIEAMRQAVLKKIACGDLSKRQGMEIMGELEWRFGRELEKRQVTEQKQKRQSD